MNTRALQHGWLCAAGLLFCAGAQAANGIARLEDFLAQLDTLRGHFTQTVRDGADVIEQAQGQFAIARPDRFRWAYESPYEQLIVADGERLWSYDAELEQVIVKPQENAFAGTPAWLLTTDQPLTERFLLVDQGEQDGRQWVLLTPRDEAAEYSAIRLGFDAQGLAAMQLTDGLGLATELAFTEVRRNAALDPALFRFEPPAGADVVGEPLADE